MVRVGDTVRKPNTHNSGFVRRLLIHLARTGFQGSPRYLGMDERGRGIVTYIPGFVPPIAGEFSEIQIEAAARLLRALHDATSQSDLKGGCEIVCHGDASPCNFVFEAGLPYAMINFDLAEPGTRSSELGHAAWHWLGIGDDELTPLFQGKRLAKFFADYGVTSVDDPIAAVLLAQLKVYSRAVAPVGDKEWALECLEWTMEWRRELKVGFEQAWKELRM